MICYAKQLDSSDISQHIFLELELGVKFKLKPALQVQYRNSF